MAKTTLKDISSLIRKLDLCTLTTVNGRGMPEGRPMSNNRDVDYDGTSYFFTTKDTSMVREIKKNPGVSLSYIDAGLLSKRFINVSGKADLITDKEVMRDHWNPDLEIWFKDGIDTKGIVMIKVQATHLKMWEKNKETEVNLTKARTARKKKT